MDWELASDHAVSGQVADTFNMTRGTIIFDDGARMRNITLRVLIFLRAFYCHSKVSLVYVLWPDENTRFGRD